MAATEPLLQLWAKWKRETPESHYPLLFHMLDVAMVTQEMWRNCLQAGARGFLSKKLGLPEEETCSWISFWAGLHDIGKASPVFQGKNTVAKQRLEAQGLIFERHLGDIPHGAITSYVFPEVIRKSLPEINFLNEMIQTIGIIVGGHHGIFEDKVPGPRQRGTGEWDKARLALTTKLATLLDILSLPAPRHVSNNTFYVMLAGLTSVADWLASNEHLFPWKELKNEPVEEHMQPFRQQAKEVLHDLGWSTWVPSQTSAPFQQLFPFITQLYPLQKKVIQLSESSCGSPGLVIIEAPMGEGKTEAALYLADRWATMLAQKGCYIALPTQATSNQMFTRTAEFLQTRYHDSATNLQLVHGSALLSQNFASYRKQHLQEAKDSNTSDDLIAAEWFLPRKRGLLAPLGEIGRASCRERV